MKIYVCLAAIILLSFGVSCNGDKDLSATKKNSPPDGWTQRVNNKLIGRVTRTWMGARNCAVTKGRNIECQITMDSILETCFLIVTYTDETVAEKWELSCIGQTLMFDDGTSSYFYGRKRNP